MAYRDPYDPFSKNGHTADDDEFNPYSTRHRTHPSYDQSGSGYENYHDVPDPVPSAPHRQATMRSDDDRTKYNKELPPVIADKAIDEDRVSGFDRGEFSARPENFRSFNQSLRGGLWTSGSRVSCIGRFCCCTLWIVVFLLVSIVLTLLLWVRPPAVTIGQVGPTTTGNQIQIQTDSVSINLAVNISVHNPNYFSIGFSQIKAEIFYPIGNTPIGGGTSNNVNFPSGQTTNVTFPFSISYKFSLDPDHQITNDLVRRCKPPSDITINYQITPGIRILFVTISPEITNSLTFTCPLSGDQVDQLVTLAGLLQGTGSS